MVICDASITISHAGYINGIHIQEGLMKPHRHAGAILLMLLAFASAAGAEDKIKSLCDVHYPSDTHI